MKDVNLSQLQDLLERERCAILSCEFSELEDISQEKESIVEALLQTSPEEGDMADVMDLMARNQRLLEAAMNGVRGAQNSLKVIDKAIHGSTFYGCDGQVNHTPNDVMSFSRKI